MFGTLEKLYYFCGVGEQTNEFESNEVFLKTFHSNACINENFFVPLQRKQQILT